jgi:hypothetical protein
MNIMGDVIHVDFGNKVKKTPINMGERNNNINIDIDGQNNNIDIGNTNIEKQVNNYGKRKPKVIPPQITDGLSPEQRFDFLEMVKKISWQLIYKGDFSKEQYTKSTSQVYMFAYGQAGKLKGKVKISNINMFRVTYFDTVMKYLKEWERANNRNPLVHHNSKEHKKYLFSAINAKKRDLGLIEEEYRALLVEKYGCESLDDLIILQLVELSKYFDKLKKNRAKTHNSKPKEKRPSKQKRRERYLQMWLDETVKPNPNLDSDNLPYQVKDILVFLIDISKRENEPDKSLFKEISESVLRDFWSAQQLCNCSKEGRPPDKEKRHNLK